VDHRADHRDFVLSIASSAIGLQCLDKNKDSSSNHGYLMFILGTSVLALLIAFLLLWHHMSSQSAIRAASAALKSA